MTDTTGETHLLSLDMYSLDALRQLVDKRPRLGLNDEVTKKVADGASFVLRKSREGNYIYGVNTGFGSLCETRVPDSELELLQHNHVLSHAAGVGEIVGERICRFMLLIKLLTFRHGNCGISMNVVQRMVDFWNNGVIPAVPKKGTVGASGDLAPLAHMALPLLGLGKIHHEGKVVEAAVVMQKFGWKPLSLGVKEGLALTNGVQYIDAIAVDCLVTLQDLVKLGELIASLSVQGFSCARSFFHASYHETSYHLERRVVAANLRKLLDGGNHASLPTCNKSQQDPYSFRCIPQVHGAIRQAAGFAVSTIEREINGVSDNPLFFPEQDLILFGGNLHGQSTAFALDFAAMASSELGSISERRTYQLMSGQRGLPSFLVGRPGVNSGLMIIQYTAAALVNESKVLCTPASVDTIMTCQLQEDHVSMGGTSAYKLQTIVENTAFVLAIEAITAAQAVDLLPGLELSPETRQLHKDIRAEVAFLESDRILSDDITRTVDLCRRSRESWLSTLA